MSIKNNIFDISEQFLKSLIAHISKIKSYTAMNYAARCCAVVLIVFSVFSVNAQEDVSADSAFFYVDTIPQSAIYNDSLAKIIPAYAEYKYIWTSQRLNAYRPPIDSLPQYLVIDTTGYHYPTDSNKITSRFGMRRYRYHYGVDIGLHIGDTVRATFSGKVRIVDYERRGYGHYVVIRHNNGLETVSAHLSRPLVKIDQEVKAGEPIGLGGSTGRSTGPHLHYEIRYLGNPFNPIKMIDFKTRQIIGCNDEGFVFERDSIYSHKKEVANMKNAAYYKVKQGDTLSGIARRYGTTVRNLCALNGIKSTSILRIGQRIRYR